MPRFLGTWKRYNKLNPRWWDRFQHGTTYTNVCITQGASDANFDDNTWYGASLEYPMGSINPAVTKTGQTIYSIKWNALGDFVMQLGDLGDEQAPDANLGRLNLGNGHVSMEWTGSAYEGDDLDLATYLIANYEEGVDTCGTVLVLPSHLISYNFTIQRGV